MTDAGKLRVLGFVVVVLCAAHVVEIVIRRDTTSLFWMCNLTGPLVAAGCLAARRALVSVPLLWMVTGTLLWLADVATGGVLYPTALLSHVGVLAVGVVAVRAIGWGRGIWWKASVLQFGFLAIARLFTAPADNVNLAFAVPPGWRDLFPSYPAYIAVLWASTTLLYAALDALFRRIAVPPTGAVSCAG